MPNEQLETISKKVYKYLTAQEGDRPDMNGFNPIDIRNFLIENRKYLISIAGEGYRGTPEGDKWAYGK